MAFHHDSSKRHGELGVTVTLRSVCISGVTVIMMGLSVTLVQRPRSTVLI